MSFFSHSKYLSIVFLMTISVIVKGQLPKTDVYLVEFKNLFSKPQVTSIKYLNDFNANGYNNQPRFFGYDDLYMSVAMDTNQVTDIYHVNVKNETLEQVTNTKSISEFSPILRLDKTMFSTVRIEADGFTQTLFQQPIDRSNQGKRLMPKLGNIGYVEWLSSDSIAIFLVANNNTLAIANTKSGKVEIITENPGRCLRYGADGFLYFVQKVRPDLWLLKKYHITDKAISTVIQMPNNREDFEILANGSFIIGDGSKMKMINPEKDVDWQVIADFSKQNILNINRLSCARDRIVFVNNK